LISLTKIKDIHTHLHTSSNRISLLSSVMTYDDSSHWHGRAREMLARAEQMNECVTKHVLRRVADAYEGLARKAEKQPEQLPPNRVSKRPVMPTEMRQFAPRKDRLIAHVKQMDECASELVLRRVSDACECLARTAEQRAKRFPPNPLSKTAPPARVPRVEIPGFLKRGPRMEEDVIPFGRKSLASVRRLKQILFFKPNLPKAGLARDHDAP
jgi:hypothetical protein